jgi:hypothetical protein
LRRSSTTSGSPSPRRYAASTASWSVTHPTRQPHGKVLDDGHALSFVLGALEAKEDVVLPQRASDAGVRGEVEALTVLHVFEMDVDECLQPPQAFAGSDYRRNVCLFLDGPSHRLEQHQGFRVGELCIVIRGDDSNGRQIGQRTAWSGGRWTRRAMTRHQATATGPRRKDRQAEAGFAGGERRKSPPPLGPDAEAAAEQARRELGLLDRELPAVGRSAVRRGEVA